MFAEFILITPPQPRLIRRLGAPCSAICRRILATPHHSTFGGRERKRPLTARAILSRAHLAPAGRRFFLPVPRRRPTTLPSAELLPPIKVSKSRTSSLRLLNTRRFCKHAEILKTVLWPK